MQLFYQFVESIICMGPDLQNKHLIFKTKINYNSKQKEILAKN